MAAEELALKRKLIAMLAQGSDDDDDDEDDGESDGEDGSDDGNSGSDGESDDALLTGKAPWVPDWKTTNWMANVFNVPGGSWLGLNNDCQSTVEASQDFTLGFTLTAEEAGRNAFSSELLFTNTRSALGSRCADEPVHRASGQQDHPLIVLCKRFQLDHRIIAALDLEKGPRIVAAQRLVTGLALRQKHHLAAAP